MLLKLKRDERGIGILPVLGIILILLVSLLVAVRVSNQQKKETPVQQQGVSKSQIADVKLNQECLEVYKDDALCRFISLYKIDNLSYQMTLNQKDSEGTTKSIYLYDGKGNIAVKENGKDTNYVETKAESFIKDEGGLWYRVPAEPEETEQSVNPLTDAVFPIYKDTETGSTISYKNQGKQKCGQLSCWKYLKTSADLPNVSEQFWFDTKEYKLRRYLYKDTEISQDMTVNYKSVRVSKPSAVKELADDVQE
jgi:hypothetical protein